MAKTVIKKSEIQAIRFSTFDFDEAKATAWLDKNGWDKSLLSKNPKSLDFIQKAVPPSDMTVKIAPKGVWAVLAKSETPADDKDKEKKPGAEDAKNPDVSAVETDSSAEKKPEDKPAEKPPVADDKPKEEKKPEEKPAEAKKDAPAKDAPKKDGDDADAKTADGGATNRPRARYAAHQHIIHQTEIERHKAELGVQDDPDVRAHCEESIRHHEGKLKDTAKLAAKFGIKGEEFPKFVAQCQKEMDDGEEAATVDDDTEKQETSPLNETAGSEGGDVVKKEEEGDEEMAKAFKAAVAEAREVLAAGRATNADVKKTFRLVG